jgi:hypothetical protein
MKDFEDRLGQVQQLVDAHGALVRLKHAEAAMENMTGGISQIKGVIDALVSDPKKGRPPEVQALSSAAVALLSAHLQGFVTDLFQEAARSLLAAHVPDVAVLINAAHLRGNPNEQNIIKLFASIGVPDVISGISWQKCSNSALRKKLRDFNELRNRIVHGKAEVVHKKSVVIYMGVWKNFAERLDKKVGSSIAAATGVQPW